MTWSDEELVAKYYPQPGHRMADGRLGHRQPFGGAREASFLVRRLEHRQQVEINAAKVEHGAYRLCEIFSGFNSDAALA